MEAIKPQHYKAGDKDVISFCHTHDIGFCLGNAIKYMVRAGKKDPAKEIEDLEKAAEFLRREIEHRKAM